MLPRVLVSACLMGEKVRYHGGDARRGDAILGDGGTKGGWWRSARKLRAGSAVPRAAAEIGRGDGRTVLLGEARVTTQAGADVSAHFLAGARQAAALAAREGIRVAVLKEGSPSCGSGYVYDGSFMGGRHAGVGVTTALLEEHGIRVFAEHQIAEAAAYLATL